MTTAASPRICVHCGKEVAADRDRLCNHCGLPFSGDAAPAPQPRATGGSSSADQWRLLLGVGAALLLAFGGYEMVTLRSVSGDSVAEAFYNAAGWGFLGLAILAIAVVLPRGEKPHQS